MPSAYISEIYTSLQGEGPFTGQKQIFVRLAGCPLRCNYCDTPDSLTATGHPRVSVAGMLAKIKKERRAHGANVVSFTGGEPLAHSSFLKEALPLVKKNKFSVYLETAGIHPSALGAVASFCDVIAMDMKLPSAVGKPYWKEHSEFLRVGGSKIFVKVVIERSSTKKEVSHAVAIASKPSVPPLFVLQPATKSSVSVEVPTEKQVGEFYRIASRKLPRVLVMPQQHKMWGIR